MKVDLEFPIELEGSIIRSLVLRVPTPADFVGMENIGPGQQSVRMLAILGDLPEQLIHEIDASDLLSALRAVAEMLQQLNQPR